MQISITRAAEDIYTVRMQTIDDWKTVYATVQSTDQIPARARSGGTITSLSVEEGDEVKPNQIIAEVIDPKLQFKLKSLDASMLSSEALVENAKTELDRATKLVARGVSTQASLDAKQTAYRVALNQVASIKAQQDVIREQLEEGKVLSPSSGRILEVPVTKGSVVFAGDTIAQVAANKYILRLQIPERHARFIQKGDKITLGARGLRSYEKEISEGKIIKLYPKLQNGHVTADAHTSGLNGYFVGERVLVRLSAGKRKTYIVPLDYITQKFGLDYVKLLQKDGKTIEIAVQRGQTIKLKSEVNAIEILTGLKDGDRLVKP